MKKENIVKKNWEFQQIISNKKQLINKYLIIYYIDNDKDKCEIGISIPKKFTNAVKRNYLKRQIKAIIDKNEKILTLNQKIIIISRKDFIKLSFENKKYHINKLLDNLYKNLRKN